MLEGTTPVVVDQFGGFVTSVERGDLNNGLAARAIDCEFFPGGVKSRGPFADYLSSPYVPAFAASPVTSILSFPRQDNTRHRLFLHDNGTLDYEYPEGIVTTIETGLGNHQIMRGCILNNRAFMAFSDGKTPGTRPRWWDGKWFDPVGQEGPAVNAALNAVVSLGNATEEIVSRHQSMTLFETRGGYFTEPSFSTFDGIGMIGPDKTFRFTVMPLPPANVVRTRIAMTTQDGTDFYAATAFQQAPPASGTWDVPYSTGRPGVSDTDIAGGRLMTHERLTNWVLPPCLGVESYNSRLVAWGALNNIPKLLMTTQSTVGEGIFSYNISAGLQNGTFTGGLTAYGYPSGWQQPLGPPDGGALVDAATAPGATLMAWQITGDGANVARGVLLSASGIERFNDYPPGTEYWARIRAKRSAGLNQGSLKFGITSSTTGDMEITYLDLTEDWQWFTAPIWSASDTTVGGFAQLYADGTPTNNETITVDEIQIYSFDAPTLDGYLVVSNPNDLETFDYTRGLYPVRPGDGQPVINCAELRGTLYAFKEKAIFGVTDNQSDPYQWPPANLMDDQAGCFSVHGIGRGNGWLATICESGVYVFSGGQAQKISQEIQPTWNTINFNFRHLSWCVVDAEAQRIYIGVPLGDAEYVNALFVCDYVSGLDIDPVKSPGDGRKWSVWQPPDPPGYACGARIDRDNGQRMFVIGGGISGSEGFVSSRNPKLADYAGSDVLVPGAWGDSNDAFGSTSQPISATYETATIGQPQERSFFAYVVAKMHGNGGNIGLELVRPDGTTTTRRERALDANPRHDLEWQIADNDTQIGLRFTNSADGVFSIKRAAAYYKKAATSRVRGF